MAPAPLGNRVFVKAVDRRAKGLTKNYLDKAKGVDRNYGGVADGEVGTRESAEEVGGLWRGERFGLWSLWRGQ